MEQGQFISGACAGALKEPISLKDFHRNLAEGALAEGLPFVGPLRPVVVRPIVEAAQEEFISIATGPPAANSRLRRAGKDRHHRHERSQLTGEHS